MALPVASPVDCFPAAIEVVLAHEGGFCNDPADPGGATNFGVSLYWLKSVGDLDGDGFVDGDLNHDGRVDINDIRLLTRDQAKGFYRRLWWDHYGYGGILDPTVATKVFDLAVNMGGIQCHKLVQRALLDCGCPCLVDGILGPGTLSGVNAVSPLELVCHIRNQAEKFYRALVDRKPALGKFLRGWLRRAAA